MESTIKNKFEKNPIVKAVKGMPTWLIIIVIVLGIGLVFCDIWLFGGLLTGVIFSFLKNIAINDDDDESGGGSSGGGGAGRGF